MQKVKQVSIIDAGQIRRIRPWRHWRHRQSAVPVKTRYCALLIRICSNFKRNCSTRLIASKTLLPGPHQQRVEATCRSKVSKVTAAVSQTPALINTWLSSVIVILQSAARANRLLNSRRLFLYSAPQFLSARLLGISPSFGWIQTRVISRDDGNAWCFQWFSHFYTD